MTQRFRRSDQALHSGIGDDVVALHIERGECFGMGNVSAEVWRLLDKPNDLDGICAALTGLYEVEPAQCRDDVGALLAEMVDAGLIEPA